MVDNLPLLPSKFLFLKETMNGRTAKNSRTSTIIGFVFGVMIGSALVIYLKLWSVQSTYSSQETELLRKEFDRASMEAMDESAEWRMKYDAEVERAKHYKSELEQVKTTFSTTSSKLEALQKENILLQNQVESLKVEVHSKNLPCKCNQTTKR